MSNFGVYKTEMGKFMTSILWLCLGMTSLAQSTFITGTVYLDTQPAAFAQVFCQGLQMTCETNELGQYHLGPLPEGSHEVSASYVGFQTSVVKVSVKKGISLLNLDFHLQHNNVLNEVVVTGTKTFQRKDNSPVIVNVLSRQSMDNVQACNVAEGLRFQSGLRVETDCQTCNYTQLRMNGLGGAYSQILINGRPVFSPLTGLYGLEQLPSSMIERIEVVRGGASSTYGPGAIGGTVNIITRLPKKSGVEGQYNYQTIDGQTTDHSANGNLTFVNKNKNMGISGLLNYRNRSLYDHNGDLFSELPQIKNTSTGLSAFYLPGADQKLEFSFMQLQEYRLGGQMAQRPVHLLQQAEERTHRVMMANVDYQHNFNRQKSSFLVYVAWQRTLRDHYTGIFPDEPSAIEAHLSQPPYGDSKVVTLNGGFQINHQLVDFIKGKNTLTLGGEYVNDQVKDEIMAYHYKIDQLATNFGFFFQSDWQWSPKITLLSGLRADIHNKLQSPRLSPRLSLLYKFQPYAQFRFNWGSGFRPPQAFDTDLHIAFAGGGVSRVTLQPQLLPETSQSLSFSFNYDKATQHFIAGFTLESFFTQLNNAFFLYPLGPDAFGEVFEKRNGSGAIVRGMTLELRANFDGRAQLESGFTWQQSRFLQAVQYIENIPATRQFIRTPATYAYSTLTLNANKFIAINLNYLYTGSMVLPHFAGAPEQSQDEMVTTHPFHEVSLRVNYRFPAANRYRINLFVGLKNIFNSYQADFDSGKNRDSNYIYGPAQPRSLFIGMKWEI